MIVSDTESTMASEEFKKIYYLRTRSERVFSRLLSLEFQSSVNIRYSSRLGIPFFDISKEELRRDLESAQRSSQKDK